MKLKPIAAALAAAGLLAAGSAGAWSLGDLLHRSNAATTAAPTTNSAPAPAAVFPATAPNYREIVQKYGPAVVGVTVAGMHKVSTPDMPEFFKNDPFFQFFRGLPGFQFRFYGPHESVPFRGEGSGFIISSDGLILTAAHVVRDAKDVKVRLADRREFRAKVLGSDPATDVAVLKIDAKNLPTVILGDANQVQVGDYVLAIGAPYGFEETATQGIVSAKGRSLPGDSYVPFIQTDAAVNPGNSGGPLFDAQGRVIGINAQIYTQSGGFQGLAFAIPINVALHVKDQLVKTGHVEHARLGVTLQDLTQSLADSFGLKSPDGALISSVMPGSAAAKADLKPGDVITAINGEPVRTASDVSTRIGLASPGDRVRLQIWRDKSSRDVDVKLGVAPSANVEQAMAGSSQGSLGLAVRPLTPDERKEAHTDHGLMVEGVEGPAAQAGIQPGDIVLAIDGEPVTSAEQIRNALASHPKHVALLIQREDQRIFVPIDLS